MLRYSLNEKRIIAVLLLFMMAPGCRGSDRTLRVAEFNIKELSTEKLIDVDEDGVSELICELNSNTNPETKLYCLTMDGSYPAKACWPEYYHSALPVWEQYNQGLSLISAHSNSLWFPIGIDLGIALVKDLHLDQDVKKGLVSLLEDAKDKVQKDETKAAQDQLSAFQNQISQSGNKIPAERADALKNEAQKVIDSL